MKTVAEQIADWLVKHGIEQVFTVTGGGSMFLNQALGAHPNLRCTFMHHEQACAMAAEGYARIAGKPAVVMLTTGPGSINAFNGVYGAYTDSIPMIVISGQVKRETCLSFQDLPGLRQLGDQEGPTVAMAAPICKSATLIRDATDVQTVLPAAFSLAITGRPGPVWIDVPLDVQSSKDVLTIPDLAPPQAELQDKVLQTDCMAIVERLKQSNRPILLGGTGVRLAGATELLRKLVEQTGIPLATAWTHDLIASDHPLFAGRPGTIGTRAGNFCLQNADLVLVIGSRLNIRQTSYNWDSFGKNAWIVQVDVDPAELAKPGVQADLRVTADAKDFINTLLSVLTVQTLPNYTHWVAWCRDIGDLYHARREHTQKPDAALNPYVIVDRIFRQMRDDDVVACGNASACILPFQMAHLTSNQRMFSNSGSASMGFDLPSAIGASFAGPDNKRRVICFAGDGSLQMNIQELQTLKTTGRNVVVVVLNNAGYLSIWQTHENFFGRVIGATPDSGVEFPDFEAVATAYGIKAATIRTEDDLVYMDALLKQDGPLLLNVIVDPHQEFAPRIKSRVDENGKFITPELDDMHPFLERAELQSVAKSALAIRATA
jgi:acetolactate synthase-1/2/3 large subunit